MKKIQDLPHYVLFRFITEDENEFATTNIQDILSITNQNNEHIDEFYIGNKIILDDEVTYEIMNISVFNISEYIRGFRAGTLLPGITSDSKDYLFGVNINLRELK